MSGRLVLVTLTLASLWFAEALSGWVPTAAQTREEAPPSGALAPAPLNATFDTKPERLIAGAVDSKGQPTGEPPGWEVSRGEVRKDRSDEKGDYATLRGKDTSLVSAPFTVDANAKQISFSYRFFEQSDSEKILHAFILSGDSYAKETEVFVRPCVCETGWEKAWIDVERFAGQNIKLRFERSDDLTHKVGIDDVATNLLEAKLGRHRSAAFAGDPVDTSNGNLAESFTDIPPIPGKGVPLGFTRYYNSNSNYYGNLGSKWTNTYSINVVSETNGIKTVRYADGSSASFTPVCPCPSPPVFDGAASGFANLTFGGSTFGWNHTASAAANRVALVGVYPGVPQSVTFGGQTMTLLSSGGGLYVYYLLNPPSGTQSVSVNYGSNPGIRVLGVSVDFFNAAQTPPVLSASNTTLNDMVADFKAGSVSYPCNINEPVPGPGQTVRTGQGFWCVDDGNDNPDLWTSTKPGVSPSTSMSWTGGASGGPQRIATVHGTGTAVDPVLFTSSAGNFDKLQESANGTYVLTTRSQIRYSFDVSGRLTSIADRNNNSTTIAYDSSGYLASVTDSSGRALTFTNYYGLLSSVTDPLGRTVTFSTSGDLVTVGHILGGSTTYTYSGATLLKTETNPAGNLVFENTYDGSNRVYKQKRIHNGSPAYTCFKYGSGVTNDTDCQAVSPAPQAGETIVVDARNNKTKYSFDASFRTSQIVNALSGVTSFGYDANSNLTCVTDALSNKSAYAYDSSGNLTQTIDSLNTTSSCSLKSGGKTTTVTYTAKNDPLMITDRMGRKTENTYDTAGNLTQMDRKDASNVVKLRTCYTVDSAGLVTEAIASTTLTNCTGNKTVFEHDAYGNVVAVTNPRFASGGGGSPTVSSVTPSSFGSDATAHNVAMPTTVSVGDLLLVLVANDGSASVTTPTGWTQLWSQATGTAMRWSGYARVADGSEGGATVNFVTSASEQAAAQVYRISDWYGALSGIEQAGATGTNSTPNPPSLTPSWGSASNLWLAAYGADDDDDATAYPSNYNNGTYTQSSSTTTSASVASARRTLTAATDDPGGFTMAASEEWGARTIAVRAAVTPKSTATYDLGGRVLTATNELGHTSTFTYNAANEVLTAKDNLNNTTTYTYDALGKKKTVKDALNNTTTFNYDNLNRLTSVVDALSGTTSYQFDANDNRTQVTDARGKTRTATYDALNRPVTATDALGTTNLTYDALGRVTLRVEGSDVFTTAYTYDAANRLTRTEYRDDDDGTYNIVGSVVPTYDDEGNRTQMVDSTGTTTYAYDALNRVTSVTSPGPKTVSYTYSNAGNRSRTTYPDSKYVDYGYDAANNLTSVTDWLSNVTSYAYNNAGALTTTTLPSATGITSTRNYDDADRLTVLENKKGANTLSSFTYTLNAVGNRTQVVDQTGTTTYGYDNLHRLTSVTYPGPTTDTYTYDAVGNRLTKNSTSYTYGDAEQMLTAAGVSYGYDARGNQTSRASDTFAWDHENRMKQLTISGATSSYTYNGDGVRMSSTTGGNTTNYVWDVAAGLPVILQDGTNTYVYGLGLVSTYDGTNMTYRLTDGLGSTINLCDATGNVLVTYAYDAFGGIRSQTGSSSNYFKFTGEQRDSESGFDYLRARYYDPEVGRFLGQDTMGGGYGYALNNPANATDPTGRIVWVQPWEDATYADTLMFYIAQLQVEFGDHIDEGLFEYFEASGAMGVLLIHGPIERCYDDFTSCSARDGVRVQWRPQPDPYAVIDINTCLDPDCTRVWYCQAATSGCVSEGGATAQTRCHEYYCCQWGSDCATKLPNHPWECGIGILQIGLGVAGLATTPISGGWGIAFGLTNLAIGSGVTYASCT